MNSPFGATELRLGDIFAVASVLGVPVEDAVRLVARPDFPAPSGGNETWDLDNVCSWNLMFG